MNNWQAVPLAEADFIDQDKGFRLTHYVQWELLDQKLHNIGKHKVVVTPHWGETLHRLLLEAREKGDTIPPRLLKRLATIHPTLANVLKRDGID